MQFGATVEGVKAHGTWSQSGSFYASYYRSLPVDAMLATAHFDGQNQDGYSIARASLGMFRKPSRAGATHLIQTY